MRASSMTHFPVELHEALARNAFHSEVCASGMRSPEAARSNVATVARPGTRDGDL